MREITYLTIFLGLTVISKVAGEKRFVHFKRSKGSDTVIGKHISVVHCAVLCSSKETCQAFRVHDLNDVCLSLSQKCRGANQGEICFTKKADATKSLDGNVHAVKSHKEQQIHCGTEKLRKEIIYKQLLLVPYDSSDPPYVMSLDTKTVQEYPTLTINFIISITYMPISKNVLVCAGRPRQILTWQLEQQKAMKLINSKADAIAADETAKAIFYLNIAYKSKIYKMTTEGDNRSVILKTKDRPVDLLVDSACKQLYVSFVVAVVTLDYTGLTLRTYAEGRSIYSLALDPSEDTLYFNKVVYIMRTNIATTKKDVKQVTRVQGLVKDLEYHKGSLYAGSTSGVFEIQNISDKTSYSRIELESTKRQLLCLIH